jgi:hypothetical protein
MIVVSKNAFKTFLRRGGKENCSKKHQPKTGNKKKATVPKAFLKNGEKTKLPLQPTDFILAPSHTQASIQTTHIKAFLI